MDFSRPFRYHDVLYESCSPLSLSLIILSFKTPSPAFSGRRRRMGIRMGPTRRQQRNADESNGAAVGYRANRCGLNVV